jgi:hypothetical protein
MHLLSFITRRERIMENNLLIPCSGVLRKGDEYVIKRRLGHVILLDV